MFSRPSLIFLLLLSVPPAGAESDQNYRLPNGTLMASKPVASAPTTSNTRLFNDCVKAIFEGLPLSNEGQSLGSYSLKADQQMRKAKMWEEHQRSSPIIRSFMHDLSQQGRAADGKEILSWAWDEAHRRDTTKRININTAVDDYDEHPKVTYFDLVCDAGEFVKAFDEYCSSFHAARAAATGNAPAETAPPAGKRPFELRPLLVLNTNEQAVYALDKELQQDIAKYAAAQQDKQAQAAVSATPTY